MYITIFEKKTIYLLSVTKKSYLYAAHKVKLKKTYCEKRKKKELKNIKFNLDEITKFKQRKNLKNLSRNNRSFSREIKPASAFSTRLDASRY